MVAAFVFTTMINYFFSRLGNHPFSTLLRCSNSSPIDHSDDAPHTAKSVDHNTFSTMSDAMIVATPISANTLQMRVPK